MSNDVNGNGGAGDHALMTIIRGAKLIALFGGMGSALILAVINVSAMKITLGGEEQNVIFGIQTLLDGHDLYQDPNRLPFVVTQYTPLFHDLCFVICRGLGLRSGDLHDIYLVGRLTSAIASLGCCLTMFAILTRYTRLDVIMRLALAFLLPLLIGSWAFVARPDPLYLFLVTAGLWAAMDYAETLRPRMLLMCAILLLAGFYTKQTALFLFPLPFLTSFARRWWSAFRLKDMGICLAIYAAGAVFMTPAMAENFAVGLGNGIDLPQAVRNVYLPALHHAPLMVVAGTSLRQAWRGPDWRPRAIGIATLWFLIVGASLAIKFGSSYNYLDEAVVGCLLLAGMAPRLAPGAGGHRTVTMALIGLVIVEQMTFVYFDLPGVRSLLTPEPALYEAGRALATAPELRGRPVMILNYSALIFIPDRAALAPAEVVGSSAASGHFDLTPVTQAVRDGRLCFAITDRDLLPSLFATPGSRDDPSAWMAIIGRTLLANFHAVRDFGPMVLLAADSCGQNSH